MMKIKRGDMVQGIDDVGSQYLVLSKLPKGNQFRVAVLYSKRYKVGLPLHIHENLIKHNTSLTYNEERLIKLLFY